MGKRSMRTIVIANQKGGVAKTTTAVNLASEMSVNGRRVLLVDFDPQRSSTSSIFGNVEFELSTYDLLFESVAADEIIQTSPDFGVDVIPSDIMLSSAELKLASIIGREKTLANSLTDIKRKYDICIIDTPPTLGLLSICALVASGDVLVPICPEYFSLKGLRLFEETMESVRRNMGARLNLLGVLVTRNRKRVIVDSALRAIDEYFGDKVFKTTIPEDIRVEEAHNAHLPLRKYAPKSKSALAYRELAKEIDKCLNESRRKTQRRKSPQRKKR